MGPAGILFIVLGLFLLTLFVLPSKNAFRVLLLERLPHFLLHTVFRAVFGQRGVKCLQEFWHYVCWEPNPLLQVLYLMLVGGGFIVGVTEAFRFVPNPYIDSYHKGVFIGIFALLMISFFKVCSVEPGYITSENHHKHNRYPYDLRLYFPTVCRTEKFVKPARSKFCKVTQRTVARFDHYCVWIAQPVGEQNYKYFLFFLFMTCVYMIYAAVQVGTIFYHIIQSNDLMSAVFINKATGEEVHADTYVLYSFLSSQYRLLFVAWATCVVMGILVTFFFFYHVKLSIRNITTNESYKIATFKRSLKKAQEINDELSRRDAMKAAGKELPADLPELPLVPRVYQMMVDADQPYTHFYDHGSIWANLREILFPRCYEPDAKYPNARKLVPPTPGSIDAPSKKQNAATNRSSHHTDQHRAKGKSKATTKSSIEARSKKKN